VRWWGGASSSQEDVKDTVASFVEAMIDEQPGEACAKTTNVEDCLGSLALAQASLGEGGIEALLPSDWARNSMMLKCQPFSASASDARTSFSS
jgi:hypothetical protein